MIVTMRMIYDRTLRMLDRSSGNAASSDRLGEILHDLRLVGVSYGHCRLREPWGVSMAPEANGRLHVVVVGCCWLQMDGDAPVLVEAGDVVLFPRGAAHSLSDIPGRPTMPLTEFPREQIGERTYHLRVEGPGSETLMACCTMRFEEPAAYPLLTMMPSAFILKRAAITDPVLPTLLDAMSDEVLAARLGSSTVLARLADLVVVRVIRSWVENDEEAMSGWLAAVRDPNIGRALSAFHRQPGEAWTVSTLAAVAGLSRTVFFERFSLLTGVSPARYMRQWRIRLAATRLKAGARSISELADQVGYGSDAAFSRAFKRDTGVSPGAVRPMESDDRQVR
jgi:AraC-like DNA-binding protein